MVNGTHKSVQDTSYAPAAVINALKRLGWVIPSGEQDAHELLIVLLSTLEDEIQKTSRKVVATFVCQKENCKVDFCKEYLSVGVSSSCLSSNCSYRKGSDFKRCPQLR